MRKMAARTSLPTESARSAVARSLSRWAASRRTRGGRLVVGPEPGTDVTSPCACGSLAPGGRVARRRGGGRGRAGGAGAGGCRRGGGVRWRGGGRVGGGRRRAGGGCSGRGRAASATRGRRARRGRRRARRLRGRRGLGENSR